MVLDELRLDHRSGDRDERLAGEHGRALGHSPHVAFELEVPQVVEKRLGETAAPAQVRDVLLGEVQVLEIVDQLLDARHDRIAAPIGHAAEEHVKVRAAVGDAFFKVAVRHRELIKVGSALVRFLSVIGGNAPLRTLLRALLFIRCICLDTVH